MTVQQTVMSFGDVLREHARSRPKRTAIVDGETRLTYEQLDERVTRLSNALRQAGVTEGERILWLGQNSFRLLELLLASAKLGAIFSPANWRQSVEELEFVTNDLQPRAVVWQEEELGEQARALRARTPHGALWICQDTAEGAEAYESLLRTGSPDDPEDMVDPALPLLALYTAAFEGAPNAALLSHTALLVQNLVIGRMQEISEESVYLNSGPLFHIGGFMTTNAVLHHGGNNIMVRRSEPEAICALVEQERCSHAFIMGPTLEGIREANREGRYDLSSLWGEVKPDDYRGGIVTPSSSPWAQRPGGFGQTEVTGLASFAGLGAAPQGSAGRPFSAQVRIVGPNDEELPRGEVGEIVVRGPIVMNGYFSRPEVNAERMRGGWHHTGDLGRREPDGSLTFVGPRTTMIKSAAENIYPAEVEGALTAHPAVREVCVIGVPDERWGQSVKAVVVREEEGRQPSAEELIEHCQERIASYKKPRLMEFVDALPRTEGGQIDRAAVDEKYGGGGYPGVS